MHRSCSSRPPDTSLSQKGPGMNSPGFFAFLVRECLRWPRSWPCQTRSLHLVSAPFGAPFLRGRQSDAVVAQLVRAPVCGTGGRWFEPTQLYHLCHSSNQYRDNRSERPAFPRLLEIAPRVLLAIPLAFTQSSPSKTLWGIRNDCSLQKVPARLDAGHRALGFDVVSGGIRLYSGAATSVQRRRVSSLQRRHSGCRAYHRLHE